MADKTKIEWTDATWNPITGCSVVSPGCTNCYAMKLAGMRLKHIPSRVGLTRDTKAGPVWNGEVRFNEEWLDQPLRWKAPRMIFVCAHGDLFAEGVPNEWIDRVFAVMALAPQHTFQVLTKRAERMRDYLRDERTPYRVARCILDLWIAGEKHARAAMAGDRWPVRSIGDIDDPDDVTIDLPLPNVWLGVSAEDQKRADERVPLLLDTPAIVRWVSAEPLLGPIYFGLDRGWCRACRRLTAGTIDAHCMDPSSPCFEGETTVDAMLHWIVAGGESGAGARPMHPDWVRAIRDQCAAADVAFLFKQWGQHLPSGQMDGAGRVWNGRHEDGTPAFLHCTKKIAGRSLDGVTHDAFPQVHHG